MCPVCGTMPPCFFWLTEYPFLCNIGICHSIALLCYSSTFRESLQYIWDESTQTNYTYIFIGKKCPHSAYFHCADCTFFQLFRPKMTPRCARAVSLPFVIGIAAVKAKGMFAAKRQKLPDCASSYLRKNHKVLYFFQKSTCVQPEICLWEAYKPAKMGRGEPSISSPPID